MITIIKSPLIESKLGILRNKNTSGKNFRRSMDEISYLIAAEVAKSLIYKKKKIITPLKKTTILEINQKIVLVPILRAGLGLLEGFIKLIPESECGHIGLYRDEETYKPVEYLCKLPKMKNKLVILLDPMLATGNSSKVAINLLLSHGVKIKNIFFVSLLSSPEGIKYLKKNFKSLKIFTASIDERLNQKKFIVPGLGDAGDRYMGT
tara:strand:+ start:816 stop:1436 length:621 start_codon:yes stop_codon:yes gene_type:complete